MRQGQQHRRGRGRSNNVNNNHPGNRKGQNPLTRSFESNGPDVKVRGTPAHVAEKYLQLARDAQSSGDHVLAENYLQHAEHYNRIILAYREQQIQQSGEMVNGSGRQQHQGHRHDLSDVDDGAMDETGQGEDVNQDQPMYGRHAGDQTRDMQPSLDEPRPQHQYRQDQSQRFRDRPPRHERGERHHDRQDGSERGERSERQSERGFDRHRERQFRNPDQPGEMREMRPHRESRESGEPREPREQKQVPEGPHEIAPPAPPVEASASSEPNPATARSEAAPRRRERFGLSADQQPEFLRRPVRRPRREPEQEFAPETTPASPPAEEPSRD